ncbi:phospholipase A [Glaciecola sp. XM2]|uniref:phospholipase A n=1 Tax=Glaciecola sp. XM2 TaxID=1914931 RepID=UPI001BDF02AF|nr:phospholipase A [Glaciecola sp. XM2]MBT1452357.1 phospholipase A [Glaciecola sp. XM2]
MLKRVTLLTVTFISLLFITHNIAIAQTTDPASDVELIGEQVPSNTGDDTKVPSLLDAKQEGDSEANRNPFAITQHRKNYLLPVSYTTSANTTTVDGLNDANVDRYEAKFQISVQLPLYLQEEENNGVFFGFTSTSFWQVYNSEASKPFRETNYEPEVFYQWSPNWNVMGFRFNGAQIGFNHMSNGQDGLKSRSWNRITASALFSDADSLYYLKTWYRLPEDDKTDQLDPTGDDNPDILDFYGRAEFGFVQNFGEINLFARIRNNLSLKDNRSGIELNLTYPINDRYDLLLQYFNGYGDSLIDYNRHLQRISLGVELRFL